MTEEEKITTKELLKLIGLGALILGSAVAPGLPQILLLANKKEKPLIFNKRALSMQLKRLQKREMISTREENGKTIITLSENGKKKILQYNFDSLTINPPTQWDGKWRMVIFDIPEKHKKAREFFRNKLKSLGFYRLQDSVFVYPFPCEKEVTFIREYLDIGNYVLFLTFKELEQQTLPLNRFSK